MYAIVLTTPKSVLYIVEAVVKSYMKHIYHKEMPRCYCDNKTHNNNL